MVGFRLHHLTARIAALHPAYGGFKSPGVTMEYLYTLLVLFLGMCLEVGLGYIAVNWSKKEIEKENV